MAESERIILSAREDNSNVRLCNTNTGTVKVETRGKVKDNIVEESCHQACFIIQMLLIAGLRCICFFDSGANNQIVQLDFAKNAGFRKLSDRTSTVSVAGDGCVKVEGLWQVYLGYDKKGKLYELNCIGMSQVTSAFTEYPMEGLHQAALDR